MKRLLTSAATALALSATPSMAADWQTITEEAKGQTVYFNAWGGSEAINSYIAWAGEQIAKEYDVNLELVKINDAAQVVARILAEKEAGKSSGGSVDLIWVNGENFRTLQSNGLLQAPWTQSLPSYAYVDVEGKPTTTLDFGVPVNHQEAPWGMAQLVFMHDTATLAEPPRTMAQLLDYAIANPGRVTYPALPNFHGTTFIKQAILELAPDPGLLARPVTDVNFAATTAPLWDFLDQLHPHLWSEATTFPTDAQQMRQMFDDQVLDLAMSFNPSEASRAIANGQLADTVRTYIHDVGTLGNTHFVAIPYNSDSAAGAKVVANFLMSPAAQAHKSDPNVWGDPTVLAVGRLKPSDKALFSQVERGVATLAPEEMVPVLSEPHASWVEALEQEWTLRYAN